MEVPGFAGKRWPPCPRSMRARSRARLPPTPRSQRPDRGVGGSLEVWSNWRGAGWPDETRFRTEIGGSGVEKDWGGKSRVRGLVEEEEQRGRTERECGGEKAGREGGER